jgi:hypothetical protein
MRLAAVALWNSVLTQGQIEGIASAKTTQSILDLSPLWCVDDGPTSNAFALDLVGNVDRTAINGTSDNADDPAGWVYLGEGGGGPVLTAADNPPIGVLGRGAGW